MVSIVVLPKRAVALDFDGTVADTIQERYALVSRAWPRITNGQEYAVTFRDFREKIRPFVERPEQFFPLSMEFIDPEKYHSLGEKDIKRLEAGGMREYHAARAEIRKDPEAYLALMPPFPGVNDMFEGLSSMPLDIYFTSYKDEDGIRMFLDSINCERFVKGVFDRDRFGDKRYQLEHIKSLGYESKNIMLYDDEAKNLQTAKDMGVYPLAAPQGYEIPEKLAVYRKALPHEVPAAAKEILHV